MKTQHTPDSQNCQQCGEPDIYCGCHRKEVSKTPTGHTPGPWSHRNGSGGFGDTYMGFKIAGLDGKSICAYSSMGKRSSDEQKANARLIACAPEILEVLRELKSYAWATKVTAQPLEIRAIVNKACDAIDKVEGK